MSRKLFLLLGCVLLLSGCGNLMNQGQGPDPPKFCGIHGVYDCACGGNEDSSAAKKQAPPAHPGPVSNYRNK